MRNVGWKDIAELVGIAAIVASLIFVGMQMRQDQEIAIVDALSLRVVTTAELAGLISENRDVWVQATKGEALSEPEEAVVESLLDVIEAHYTNLFVRYSRIGPFSPDSAVRDFAYGLYQYPALRDIYERKRAFDRGRDETFPEADRENQFRIRVDSQLADLDDRGIPVPPAHPYTFW